MIFDSRIKNYKIQRVLEYSSFFLIDSPLDVKDELKKYSRGSLIRIAATISLYYGNFYDSDKTRCFFSNVNFNVFLEEKIKEYRQKNNLTEDVKISIFTYRTGMELWRNIFAIPVEEFENTIEDEDIEMSIFKILLSLNEQIFAIKDNCDYSLDELLFLNNYLTNELNNYDFSAILQTQMSFFKHLVDFIPNNNVLTEIERIKHREWGISSWREYFVTIFYLASQTENYRKEQQRGIPILNLQRMKDIDQTGLFSTSLIQNLCVNEDEYLPYYFGVGNKDQNVDYRLFRSKPLVKFKDKDEYVVINIQLLCERLFNSLYFDFLPLLNKIKELGNFNYNKDFIERCLFREAMFSCIQSNLPKFPSCMNYDDEHKNEPDFYVRFPKGNLVLIECKAIKMNGIIRDEGDYNRLLDELSEKVKENTRVLDPSRKPKRGCPEPIGLGQLINHIDLIEEGNFIWDKNIPDCVTYYPILVFEDIKLLRPGLLSILNRWFYELIEKRRNMKLKEMAVRPVMAVSISTLCLYSEYIKKKGLVKIIDEFIKDFRYNDGMYQIPVDADFDGYLRSKQRNRNKNNLSSIINWLKESK